MDRFEKWAEYIMQHGDKILEKKKQRNMLIRRISFSCASAFAAVIVIFFAWKSTPPKIELPSETVISENTTMPDSSYTDITSVQTTSIITTTSAFKSGTDRMTTTASIQTKTGTQVTVTTITETNKKIDNQTTEFVAQTQPNTNHQTTTAVQTTSNLPVTTVITEPITTGEIVEPTLKMPSVMVYDPFSPIVTEFTKMRANEAITLINEYNPNYTPDKEIGILFKFDSKECTIKVTTDHGEFWTLDKVKGKVPAEAVGKTYDIGNEGGIYWIPDELNENNDLESEILIMGEYNVTSVELGKIVVTQNAKHTFRVILKEINT